MRKAIKICPYVNAAIAVSLSLYLFLVPAAILIWDLRDPGLRDGQIPRCALRWHRSLSPKYEKWARQRVVSGRAGRLTTGNIAGTEWPLFGSVFYLWATEALQEAAQENPSLCLTPPNRYARSAIEAAAALVADPNHAGWVKQYWGPGYLEKENLFYRMLLISALTSYQKLSGDTKYEALLRGQVESLAKELDESPYGLLDDYPGQCYPIDIVPAIAAIRRADAVLGTDHSAFVARAIRGFQDGRLDRHTGLPAYLVDSKTGRAQDSARGVGLSFMLTWAAPLWPQTARDWYAEYERQFWQEGTWLAGFREYPRDVEVGWLALNDVDAGPVIGGYGVAASAFGIGAARVMGRTDQAYRLAAEGLVASWPLPDGTLLTPRILSNLSDAPYLGEAATLFALTRRAVEPLQGDAGMRPPAAAYVGLALLLVLGSYEIAASLRTLSRRADPRWYVPWPRIQGAAWAVLLMGATVAWFVLGGLLAVVLLLAAVILPWRRRTSTIGTRIETKSTREASEGEGPCGP
ncbi:MAG: hypothetical protein NTZ17_02335 [Phycisphaerae bacterium]|nr:hypothetical protein [Phycisphaerae bacterium]